MNNFLAALSLIFSKSLNEMALPSLFERLVSDLSLCDVFCDLTVSRFKRSGVECLLSLLGGLMDELFFLVITPESQLVC